MTDQTTVSAAQAKAIINALERVRHAAGGASLKLALCGLGHLPLWQRMDALETEMNELLARLKPTLIL